MVALYNEALINGVAPLSKSLEGSYLLPCLRIPMKKTIPGFLLLPLLLTSCVTVSILKATPPAPPFVTSTLPPTNIVMTSPATITPSPAPTTGAAIPTKDASCQISAVLLEDVTIPDNSRVPAGQVFTKTWRLRNTGTCPWQGFVVHYASGERMNAPASVSVPEVSSGRTVDISVDLTAPIVDGIYTTYFSLQSGNGETIAIGTEKSFYAKVIVGAQTPLIESGSISPQLPFTSLGVPAISIGTRTIYCRGSYVENAATVQELVSLINGARGNAGLSSLTWNPLLAQAAQGHSIDMACNNFLSHEGSDGSRFGELVRATGYPNPFQEIIAIGTPQNAMDQWAADPGHWEIVLNALATEMGIGYAYNANSDFGGYFTVDLH